LVIVPVSRTSCHSSEGSSAPACGRAATSRLAWASATDAARSRGAPHAWAVTPVLRRTEPIAGDGDPSGRGISVAPEASWTTIRRPEASSNVARTVTEPSTVTVAPSAMCRAVAIGMAGAARARGRRGIHDDDVGAIPEPDPVAVQRALARCALADDAGDP